MTLCLLLRMGSSIMQLTALRFFSCSWTSTQFFATPLHMFLTSVMWLCLFFQLNNPVYLMKTLLKYSQLRLAFAFLCWFFHFELNIVACSSFCLSINVHNYHCGDSTHALSLLSLCFSSSISVLSLSLLSSILSSPLLFSLLRQVPNVIARSDQLGGQNIDTQIQG